MTELAEISAEDAPALVNQMAASVTQDDETPTVAPKLPDIENPPDTHVKLPVGYWHFTEDRLVKEAEVRELTGEDEEILARVAGKNPRKFFSTILERGVVKVGDERVTESMLDSLAVGDIDALLLAIRYVTYGDMVEMDVRCPHCDVEFELNLNLPSAIPVKELDRVDDMTYNVKLRGGKVAQVTLTTYADQQEILDGKDRTVAEINSLILSRVVQRIDGEAVTLTDVRALGMKDRKTLVDAIAKHTPGPQLSQVKEKCPECSEEISLPMSMVDLFQLS